MTPVNHTAQRILEHLVDGLRRPGQAKRIDNAAGTYTAVSVECIGRDRFSVAHYGEQNGDLMSDPEMTFWRGPSGLFYATSWRNDYVGSYREAVTSFNDRDQPARVCPREQREQASFAGTWMRNIRTQQQLAIPLRDPNRRLVGYLR